jgi:hypothetical protein
VGPDGPNVYCRLNPALAFGEGGRACLVWDNKYENSDDSIGSCFWADTGWTPEVLVNQPDSFDLHFMPKVAYGGGEFWCVWYAGQRSTAPYSVLASHWNDMAGRWEPEMQVSRPPDGTYQWWCDVAVDVHGTPYVVWCNSDRRLIYCSYYNNGTGWAVPLAVNDTTLVGATGWADPRIVIDHTGMMHVCYTGVAQGAAGRDIFYTRNDGNGWSPSVRVTQDTLTNYNEWYSHIAADGPDNVWVAWDRQDEGSDQFRIHASHYDGSAWSAEVRLDGDSAYHDNYPVVCLDAAGNPWVVWTGTTYGIQVDNVYFNRYVTAAVADMVPSPARHRLVERFTSVSKGAVDVAFNLPVAGRARLDVYDALGRSVAVAFDDVVSAGRHRVQWQASIPVGTYVCRLQAPGEAETWKMVLVSH